VGPRLKPPTAKAVPRKSEKGYPESLRGEIIDVYIT